MHHVRYNRHLGGMMNGLDLLRAVVTHREPAAQAGGLPAEKLRFVIEYPTIHDALNLRDRMVDLLGTAEGFEVFSLFEDDRPDDELGVFYVLQFPGLDRTLDDAELFDIANELRARLEATTVEPDIGSTIYQEPVEPGAAIEGPIGDLFGDLFGGLCFVEGPPPAAQDWALRALRVVGSGGVPGGEPGAWDISAARGQGIRIGQPDTGVTVHTELANVAATAGRNVLDGDDDATDPLGSSGNPGHGTGTASVAVSGPPGSLLGPAPEATLVPIRCIESVIIRFNGAPVAKAIDWARTHECHIITMSLGGNLSWAVKKACKRAVEDDVIVLAAAGNCVRTVVFPARHGTVIAVAGSNDGDGTWRGSSRGGDVDVTAPGEKVWKAAADPTGTQIGGGQGTSFATALTAGVAALWLSHHGRPAVIAEARSRGVNVQDLFRQAVAATARPAAGGGWDTGDFGAGIVDARALLERPLDATDGPTIESAAGTGLAGQDVVGLVAETLGVEEATVIAGVRDRQFEPEITAAALQPSIRGGGTDTGRSEGNWPVPRLSPQLRERLEGTSSRLVGASNAASDRRSAPTRPTVRAEGAELADPAVLVASGHSALESAGTASVEQARSELRADPQSPIGALEARLDQIAADLAPTDRARLAALRGELLTNAEQVVDLLGRGEPVPPTGPSATALEALVALEGRPAVPLEDDGVARDAPLGEWAGAVHLLHPDLTERQRSVGRIDSAEGTHFGTGFVVGSGLVLTNRHVLQEVAVPVPRAVAPVAWIVLGEPVINFSPRADDPARSFRIEEVVFAGADPIDLRIDLADLDLALLRVAETNEAGNTLPAKIPVSFDDPARTMAGAKLFVVGYPAAPTVLPTDDEGRVRTDVVDVLRLIYGVDYGCRHLSPGLVQTPAAELADSPRHWIFTHDATTLGGNSGSCVLAADGTTDVVGLHVAGNWLRANYAHDLTTISALAEVLADIRADTRDSDR